MDEYRAYGPLKSTSRVRHSEDSELEHHTVRNLPPGMTNPFASRDALGERPSEGSIRPHDPGTQAFLRPMAVGRTFSVPTPEPEPLRRFQMSSLDSPLSPSRPKSPWGRFDPYDSAEDQDKEYVGFATLPNQVHRKSVKRGFDFTLMVAGESGLGKSTLVNSLFLTDLYKDRKLLNAEDSLTPAEVQKKKAKILEEIEKFDIKIYQFPECDSDEDEDFKRQDQELKDSIPFAVIGSNAVVETKGRRVRGRLYPWGIVEVENPMHSDFLKLRNMLVRTHMQDLKDMTRETHYENFRSQCIQSMTRMVSKERKRSRLTRESGTDFPIPLMPGTTTSETERLIWEKDEELRRMQEMLQKIQEEMHRQNEGH
ncbi:hypothetical protein JZ751_009348 [Albula glossodonta]|uniref:Septin-type G domain-containing protein n=1 Tax=Albula glossodonta TaxID=121402 RepID=A0A8T2N0J5_9TELE|nr:hypothetical protein JZ751_009348 [Albula glossodonta]